MLEVGFTVKDFTLKNAKGKNITLSDIKGEKTVIFFYPKNNTIGCTKEVCSFNDLKDEFTKRNITLVGISTDSHTSHAGFSLQYSIDITLLSDHEKEVSRYFGVINEESKHQRARRITFILDEDLKIIYRYDKVKPASHGQDVLNLLKEGKHLE